MDEKHSEILNQYHLNETELLPKLEEEVDALRVSAKSLKMNQIDEYMEIKDNFERF